MKILQILIQWTPKKLGSMKIRDYFTKRTREATIGELHADHMFMIQQSYIIEHKKDDVGSK